MSPLRPKKPEEGRSGTSRGATCTANQSVCFMHCVGITRQGRPERMTTHLRRAMRTHSRARSAPHPRGKSLLYIVTLYEAAVAAAGADWRAVRVGRHAFSSLGPLRFNGARDDATIGRAPAGCFVESPNRYVGAAYALRWPLPL